jgi:hypothetical protein
MELRVPALEEQVLIADFPMGQYVRQPMTKIIPVIIELGLASSPGKQ